MSGNALWWPAVARVAITFPVWLRLYPLRFAEAMRGLIVAGLLSR